jgi:hypothetical protein
MELIWIPDSLNHLFNDELNIRFEESFELAGDSMLLEQSEIVRILQDSLEFFYFQRNRDSYKIDTLPLN